MASKRAKRTTRNSRKATTNKKAASAQLCMTVVDHGATMSSCNAQNHFGYAPFDLVISVMPAIKNNDLEPQPLTAQLVFEDGQQIDTENKKNNIQFTTEPSMLLIEPHGECKFTATINTYSMYHDNRAFKLVFNLSEEATRHIRPCETKPFRLVKHRLEIVSEPDDVFYKDEGGRANCLHCKILLKDSARETVKNRDIPLTARLVYEDMSLAQSSRDILEVLTQNVQLTSGQCSVDFRINEVSKNHNKRAFRVLYECKSTDALYNDISSCVTDKIMVKSKRTKKKGAATKKSRTASARKKRKREVKRKQTPDSTSSEASGDEIAFDSDDNVIEEPARKKRRSRYGPTATIHPSHHTKHNTNPFNNFNPHLASTLPTALLNGADVDSTQYVPPALTGILPSIRAGALPRIGHAPPPFSNLCKKTNPLLKDDKGLIHGPTGPHGVNAVNGVNGVMNGGGGVLGRMFMWCKLAGWVMNRLEWTHCGFEYDEATHSIDTRRPLYRCAYCLKYRNEAGWGRHEEWCQLKLALKEYETKVKTLHNEWNYQMNNKDQGGMTSLVQSSPPPQPLDQTQQTGVNVIDKDANTNGHAPFGPETPQMNAPPFMVTPGQANGGLWNFSHPYNGLYPPQTHQSPPGFAPYLGAPPPSGVPGVAGVNDVVHVSAQFGMNGVGVGSVEKVMNGVGAENGGVSGVNVVSGVGAVKDEMMPEKKGEANNGFTLPSSMTKISSVSRVRSQHGYDAYDKDNNFVGLFDDEGAFYDADTLGMEYQSVFDENQMLWRNQSDDYLFYNNLRSSVFSGAK